MGIAIEAHNLGKRYRVRGMAPQTFFGQVRDWVKRKPAESFWAIRGASFVVEQGATVGVIGPNGAGKSSTLGLAAGTIRPTEGSITANGRISSLLELGAGFHPDLSGRENVYLNAALMGIGKEVIDERMDSIIEFAEMEKFIDQPVKTYSSGMYVRLGFAVATEVDPDVLLVDEVLAVGDLTFQRKCMKRFKEFKSKGKTILFVSHDLGTVEAFCDEAILVEEGRITQRGPAADVIRDYKERFGADDAESAWEREGSPIVVEHEYGTKRIEIEKVVLHQGDGVATDTFETCGTMVMDLHWKADEPVDDPIFGYSLKRINGEHLFGTNTDIVGLPLGTLQGRGVIQVRFDPVTFWDARYALSIAVHSRDHSEQFHRVEDRYRFTVRRPEFGAGEGTFYFDGAWSLPAGGDKSES